MLRLDGSPATEVSQRLSFDHFVLKLDEDERGLGDGADSAGAGGGMLESAPALGEQRKAALAETAGAADEGVAGAGIDIQFPGSGRPFTGTCTPAPAPS